MAGPNNPHRRCTGRSSPSFLAEAIRDHAGLGGFPGSSTGLRAEAG